MLISSTKLGKPWSKGSVDGFFGHLAGFKPRNSSLTCCGVMYENILARILGGSFFRGFEGLDDTMADEDASDLGCSTEVEGLDAVMAVERVSDLRCVSEVGSWKWKMTFNKLTFTGYELSVIKSIESTDPRHDHLHWL